MGGRLRRSGRQARAALQGVGRSFIAANNLHEWRRAPRRAIGLELSRWVVSMVFYRFRAGEAR